jgi:hypothetical protein
LVAAALGGVKPGNIVYVNGAADAEKVALQIYETLGESADIASAPEITALKNLVTHTIHPRYALASVLDRGIAFHYGNMPLIVRNEIEHLFKEGILRYLVCTSTLLEGVNLPCRNLFVRGPRKGNGNKMSAADFWNLAGRAGRWGKEFQGNIVCVDTTDTDQWPNPPLRRERQSLRRASDRVLHDATVLQSFIEEGAPLDQARKDPVLESVFSLLAVHVSQNRSLSDVTGLRIPEEHSTMIEEAVTEAMSDVEIPAALLARHAGISPLSMQRLLEYFRSYNKGWRNLLLSPPESRDAATTYVSAFARISDHLGGNFGVAGRQYQLAILVVHWMRGMPLSVLISERYRFERGRNAKASIGVVIRDVMRDVETIARFSAPKYLSCYLDILQYHLDRIGVEYNRAGFVDVTMMLELGVSRATDVSLMAIGLSRTAAIALSEYIVEDDLNPEQVLAWLRARNLYGFSLPELVLREIMTCIGVVAE